MNRCIALLLFLCAFGPAIAAPALPGPVQAEVVRVLDGDTFDVRAQIWVGHFIETRVRLNGIDTPEIRGKCEGEVQMARAAKSALEKMILQQPIYLTNIENGKYAGRVLAEAANADGADIATYMIRNGFARKYDGGKRMGWCHS